MKYQKLASLRNVTCWPTVIGTSLDYREDGQCGAGHWSSQGVTLIRLSSFSGNFHSGHFSIVIWWKFNHEEGKREIRDDLWHHPGICRTIWTFPEKNIPLDVSRFFPYGASDCCVCLHRCYVAAMLTCLDILSQVTSWTTDVPLRCVERQSSQLTLSMRQREQRDSCRPSTWRRLSSCLTGATSLMRGLDTSHWNRIVTNIALGQPTFVTAGIRNFHSAPMVSERWPRIASYPPAFNVQPQRGAARLNSCTTTASWPQVWSRSLTSSASAPTWSQSSTVSTCSELWWAPICSVGSRTSPAGWTLWWSPASPVRSPGVSGGKNHMISVIFKNNLSRAFCGGSFGLYGYAILRFLSGMGGIGAFVTAFVLAVEHAGSRFTMVLGVAIMIPFSMGEVALGLAAYLVRDWRLLQIVTHLPLLGGLDINSS